ncbi:MAG TPA: ABC transporter substrate-binding protein [Longimicrobiales bacterium]|nr:ABC transporter substrate-binding protein [Longimicrobiales bacterium]
MTRHRGGAAARAAAGLTLGALAACGAGPGERVLTFSGSVLGQEGAVVKTQLARFAALHPGMRVELRPTPDAADQRHQLYVQWLNAHASEPDVLQLDVIWTPEFAAAGWIRPLDRFRPPVDSFFPATIAANRWAGRLYALPWFVDVGMLYWRRDLLPGPPPSLEALVAEVGAAQRRQGLPYGFVWQGARYEGLVTVFTEVLGGFGGRIMDESGEVLVDSPEAVRALTYLRDLIYRYAVSPAAVLTWQEEQSRFAFQNGQSVLLRNWPYAYAAMSDTAQSRVAGRFAVAPMPAGAGGAPTAALGGSQLAVNAYSDQPADAYALIQYLEAPAQMLERARAVGQFPTRPALYDTRDLAAALAVPPAEARRVIERAVPRPVTPVYTQLSELLQIQLHRALTRQAEPEAALREAARQMRRLLERSGLSPGARHAAG